MKDPVKREAFVLHLLHGYQVWWSNNTCTEIKLYWFHILLWCSAWLSDGTDINIARLTAKVAHITGLNTEYKSIQSFSEPFQVSTRFHSSLVLLSLSPIWTLCWLAGGQLWNRGAVRTPQWLLWCELNPHLNQQSFDHIFLYSSHSSLNCILHALR